MSGAVRPMISVLLLILTALGLFNVYADNAEVKAQAEKVACDGCELRIVSESRTPVGQTFAFQVARTPDVKQVRCQRAFFLVGAYSCSALP